MKKTIIFGLLVATSACVHPLPQAVDHVIRAIITKEVTATRPLQNIKKSTTNPQKENMLNSLHKSHERQTQECLILVQQAKHELANLNAAEKALVEEFLKRNSSSQCAQKLSQELEIKNISKQEVVFTDLEDEDIFFLIAPA